MAWTKGFNFRSSAGYVTDGANETYIRPGGGGQDAYPQTRNGVTFGWSTWAAGNGDDQSTTVDPRLAGRVYADPSNKNIVRVDLEAADSYDIRVANGENVFNGNQQQIVFKDNGSTVLTVNPASFSSGHWVDATNVDRTPAATWVSSNAKSTQTFSSTLLTVEIGGNAEYNIMAHFGLDRAATGGGVKRLTTMGAGCILPVGLLMGPLEWLRHRKNTIHRRFF